MPGDLAVDDVEPICEETEEEGVGGRNGKSCVFEQHFGSLSPFCGGGTECVDG